MYTQFGNAIAHLAEQAPKVDLPDAERVQRAKAVMREKIDRNLAVDLEACVRCGYCADACQFSVQSDDPGLIPTRKLELMRRVWRRELAPLAWLWRPFTADITADDLRQWQVLCYDSCTECGRCSMVCPMGIYIARGVNVMREALAAAGLAPDELRAVQSEQDARGTVFGADANHLRQAVEAIRAKGVTVHLDKPQAKVLMLTTVLDILLFQDALEATARVLNAAGLDWTLRSNGYEAANFGLLSGVEQTQKKATEAVIRQAIEIGAESVIVPECGHAYPALRWEGAEEHGGPLPFRVLAISELIGELVAQGRLKLRGGMQHTLMFHDACKLGRHGGVFEQPRLALRATGAELREPRDTEEMNWCCGGGAGGFLINRAAPLRAQAFAIKRAQVDGSGAQALVTSCGSCRLNFLAGAEQTGWDKPILSLVEYVAQNLVEQPLVAA
ncbi:(Fe-S)-binding protein [Thiomonas sp.]|uniref:(Fe-S)-binding protein n=1 Tax=Thiomonas sp. TaxID=2047785 RepID=UPI002638B359|nr:(Fe-S)-binding protein [Thiomonas sp.]